MMFASDFLKAMADEEDRRVLGPTPTTSTSKSKQPPSAYRGDDGVVGGGVGWGEVFLLKCELERCYGSEEGGSSNAHMGLGSKQKKR